MSTSLKYQSSGSDVAKTILFLHGGGVAGWMWDPVVARMQDFHCLVPDMPEHGCSMDTRPFTMELAANQAAELVRERAHGGKAVIVGLSEGAQVTVQMLATAPELIERAVVSSALLLPMRGYGWLYSPRLLAWMFRLSVPPFRKNEWWMRLNMTYSAAIPEAYYPQYRTNFQVMNESQFVNLILANQQFRLPGNLGKVTIPTLAIAGKREYEVMKESARQLAASMSNAQAKLLDLGEGASMRTEHNWAMNAPDLFAQTIRNFITGSELPGVLHPLE
ncbi:MAG: alpha/beta hydrolase [Chloroflexota bacterium]|nr:MAG: alpha/beta hydrolase [Chloroflexota bacterium]